MTNEKLTHLATLMIIGVVAAMMLVVPAAQLAASKTLRYTYGLIPTYLHLGPAIGHKGRRRYNPAIPCYRAGA